MKKIFALLPIFFCLSIASCQNAPKPDSLHEEDICAVCKMAVSEQHFAAQALLPNGDYVKFDDIGCLLKFTDRPKHDRIWFGDYSTGQWVRADSAQLLKTDSIRTPMGYGILAYTNRDSFETAMKNLNGTPFQLR